MDPYLVDSRRHFEGQPAYWDDNADVVRRARVRLSMPAEVVTGGAARAWTTPALEQLFGVRAADNLPRELYPTQADYERVVLSRLERTARAAGFLQDTAGIWYLPDDADEA